MEQRERDKAKDKTEKEMKEGDMMKEEGEGEGREGAKE